MYVQYFVTSQAGKVQALDQSLKSLLSSIHYLN